LEEENTIMKKFQIAILAVAAAATMQAADLRANVPFAFTVGAKSMPAGEYLLKAESNGLILLRGEKSSAFKLASTPVVAAENNLVFDCSKGECAFQKLAPATATDTKMTASTRLVPGVLVAGN
jgi:hypothetical protein